MTDLNADVAKKWHKRVACLKDAHLQSSNHYERLNALLGASLISASALAGTLSALAPLVPEHGRIWSVATPLVSFVATVLAGLQIFFRFSERSERHRQAGSNYAKLEMILDFWEAAPANSTGPGVSEPIPKHSLSAILNEWAWLTGGGPVIPRAIYAKTLECFDAPDTQPLG
ncbi:MAG: hypothetical protein RLZZ597_3613 [Cyanobacteriota bacterium]|jgi:hypothetical protein